MAEAMTRLELRRLLQRQLARRARRPWIIVRGKVDGLDFMDEFPSVWHRPDLSALAEALARFRQRERTDGINHDVGAAFAAYRANR